MNAGEWFPVFMGIWVGGKGRRHFLYLAHRLKLIIPEKIRRISFYMNIEFLCSMTKESNIEKITRQLNEQQKIGLKIEQAFGNLIPTISITSSLITLEVSSLINLPNLISSYFEPFRDLSKKFGEGILNSISVNRKESLELAKKGWFLSFSQLSITDPKLIFNDSRSDVDSYFSKYYTDRLDDIKSILIKRHPNRQIMIDQIFDGHVAENYYLTIPAIFSLVDGVCLDNAEVKFFDKLKENGDYRLKLEDKISENSGVVYMFSSPIENNVPVFSHEKGLNKFECKLNRHRILHGQDADFGTKTNSLKCISLLIYVSDLIDLIYGLSE